jgi:hypothetical protein
VESVSVRPTAFNPDGSIEAIFDELGHRGTVQPEQLAWGTFPDGSGNHSVLHLPCPDGCGGGSSHQVGGGAAPREVQQLFVHKITRDGCACGQVSARTDSVPFGHVRLVCNRMDGPGRWQLDTPAMLAQQAANPETFRVIYQWTDHLIVGMEPDGAVEPTEHGVASVPIEEYELLQRTDPAWLSADNAHVQTHPPWRTQKGSP